MESHETMSVVAKILLLRQYGTGYRSLDDPLFEANNRILFKPFIRLGVYRFDDEDLCHKTNYVRCNILNCRQQFDTVFAYEGHYNSLHRFLCSQCSKSLPSAHLLDLHLSEAHDSFFAVQAEKKPMYGCYLEECSHKSQTPADRRDHCIAHHKFPHDFRFECNSRQKKHHNQSNNNNSNQQQLQPSKLMSSTVDRDDEDIELENKSILLTAQRKPLTNFSFGHRKSKTFNGFATHEHDNNNSHAKQLAKKPSSTKRPKKQQQQQQQKSMFDDDDAKMVVDDLMESLPQ